MFEKASRLKLGFTTSVGLIVVEDLWDLPLTSAGGRVNLDDIARSLHKELKNDDDVSFVVTERKSDETTQLKFDIVKHVIDVKIAEAKADAEAKAGAVKKQRILSILADRADNDLKNKPTEELLAAIADL